MLAIILSNLTSVHVFKPSTISGLINAIRKGIKNTFNNSDIEVTFVLFKLIYL